MRFRLAWHRLHHCIFLLIVSLLFLVFSNISLDTTRAKKVILVGLDGFSWKILTPLISKGELPALSRLIKEGASGKLKTMEMPSPSLWATIATGKTSQKHGIVSFIQYNKNNELELNASYHRRAKALWNIVSQQRKKVGVIGYMGTWPAEKVNGFVISDYFFEKRLPASVFPQQLENNHRLTDLIDSFLTYNFFSSEDFPYDKLKEDIKYILDSLQIVYSHLEKLCRKMDLLILYTRAPDSAGHWFWKFYEPDKFNKKLRDIKEEDIKRYGDVTCKVYKAIDKFIGLMMADIDENTVVIVCSDHGMMSSEEIGQNILIKNADALLEALGFLKFTDRNSSKIDFSQTFTYDSKEERPPFEALIMINNINQDNTLIVRLISALSNLCLVEYPDTKIFSEVHEDSNTKIYGSESIYIKTNPDILDKISTTHINIKGDTYPLSHFFNFRNSFPSVHDFDDGVIILWGKDIKKGYKIKNAHILDIAPTILYLMDLKVAKDMDGVVLTEAVEEGLLKHQPIKFIATYEDAKSKKHKGRYDNLSGDFKKEYMDKLKSLGYLK